MPSHGNVLSAEASATDFGISSTDTSVWSKAWESFIDELYSSPHDDHEEADIMAPVKQKPINWALIVGLLVLAMQAMMWIGGFAKGAEKDSAVTASALKTDSDDIRTLQLRINDLEKSQLGLQKDIERMKDEHDMQDPRTHKQP
jgi:hypothetical protein